MAIKIDLPLTWGYEEFISIEEQQILLKWAQDSFKFLKSNSAGSGRFFDTFSKWPNLPITLKEIKNKIIDIDRLKGFKEEPLFGDFLSYNLEGGAIHQHTDPNETGYIHTRYNLLVSVPDSGGTPIYNNEHYIPIKERMIWRCEAGKYCHESTPVIGKKPRINISFGFLLPQ